MVEKKLCASNIMEGKMELQEIYRANGCNMMDMLYIMLRESGVPEDAFIVRHGDFNDDFVFEDDLIVEVTNTTTNVMETYHQDESYGRYYDILKFFDEETGKQLYMVRSHYPSENRRKTINRILKLRKSQSRKKENQNI